MSVDILRTGWDQRRSLVQYSFTSRKPEGSLGRTAQDGHLDSHTAPELFRFLWTTFAILEMSHRNEKRLAPSLKNATTTPQLGLLASQLHYKSGPKALPCRHPQQTGLLLFFSSHNEVKRFITNVARWKKCKWRIPQTVSSNTGFFHEGCCLVHECVDVVDMNTETNVWYNLLTYIVSMIIVRSV